MLQGQLATLNAAIDALQAAVPGNPVLDTALAKLRSDATALVTALSAVQLGDVPALLTTLAADVVAVVTATLAALG